MIDLSILGGRAYLGRDNGKATRKHFDLDALDLIDQPVKVVIPSNTVTLASSFFLGLFAKSIINARSKAAFLKHYQFPKEMPPHIAESVDQNIDVALVSLLVDV